GKPCEEQFFTERETCVSKSAMSLCELCRVDGFLSGHGIRIQKLVDTPSLAGGANILCQALCCQELASHWLFQNMVRTDLAFGCISWYSSSAFRNDRKDI